jgi:hypothetical protein
LTWINSGAHWLHQASHEEKRHGRRVLRGPVCNASRYTRQRDAIAQRDLAGAATRDPAQGESMSGARLTQIKPAPQRW